MMWCSEQRNCPVLLVLTWCRSCLVPALTVESLLTFVVIGTLNASVTWLAVMLKAQAAPCGNTVSGVSVRCTAAGFNQRYRAGIAAQAECAGRGGDRFREVHANVGGWRHIDCTIGDWMETTVGGEALGSSVWKLTATLAGNAFAGGSLSITPAGKNGEGAGFNGCKHR